MVSKTEMICALLKLTVWGMGNKYSSNGHTKELINCTYCCEIKVPDALRANIRGESKRVWKFRRLSLRK